MKLWLRIGTTVIVFGGCSGIALAAVPHGYWFVVVCTLLGAWKVTRDVYLSGWQVEVGQEAIKLSGYERIQGSLRYDELRRVHIFWPSLRVVLSWLRERPKRSRTTGDRMYRPVIPLGVTLPFILRRLWTLSSDLLLQSGSGSWLLIPLGAMESTQRRELWMNLRLKVPQEVRQNDFRPDPALFQEAAAEEEAGQRAQTERQWSEAIAHLQKATSKWEAIGHMDNVSRCLCYLADCRMRLGQVSAAAGNAARAHRLATHTTQRQWEAYSLNLLAEVGLRLGDKQELEQSLKYMQEAAEFYKNMQDPFMECRMSCNRAIILEQLFVRTQNPRFLQECQEAAEEGLSRLLTRPHAHSGHDIRMQETNLRGMLARCAFYRHHWAEAVKMFEEASNIASLVGQRTFVEDLAMWGRALLKLSVPEGASFKTGAHLQKLNEAFYKLNEAVKLAWNSGDFNELLQVYMLRGDTFWDVRNLEAAVRDYETAVAILESKRLLFERLLERAALLRQYRRLYDRMIEGCLRLAGDSPSRGAELAERAFRYCELSKARALSEMLQLSEIPLQSVPAALRSRFEDSIRNLMTANLHRAWLHQNETDRDPQQELSAWQQVQSAEQEYQQVLQEIAETAPGLADLTSPSLPSLSDVQSWLPENQPSAVLEFSIAETALCVFLITNTVCAANTFFLIDGLGRERLQEEFLHHGFLKEYEEYARKREEYVKEKGEDTRKKLEDNLEILRNRWIHCLPRVIDHMRRMILETRGSNGTSLQQLLAEAKIQRLVVVPDGVLHRLPLHAAMDVAEITYCPSSATLIHAIHRLQKFPQRALIVANPAHGAKYTSEVFAQEARLVETTLENYGVSVSRLEGENATSAAILNDLRETSLFHFSGHAESDFRFPLGSHLKVAGDGAQLQAGTLMSHAALQRGAWVVVDACESGVAPVDPSGEYVGLSAAFLLAGASIVVSTLWAVDLVSPLVLMSHFYGPVLGNAKSVPATLRQAAEHMRILSRNEWNDMEKKLLHVESTRDIMIRPRPESDRFPLSPPFAHPFHWAPFIVCGAAWTADEVNSRAQKMGRPEQKPFQLPFDFSKGLAPELTEVIRQVDDLIGKNQLGEAIALLEKNLEVAGPVPVLEERLGSCYAEIGNFDTALEYYRKLLDYDPNSFLGYYNLGCVFSDFGHVQQARDCFQKALSLNPAHANAMCNLSELTNVPEEAIGVLKQAMLAAPDDADVPKAIKMWEALSQADPTEIAVHRLLWAGESLKAKHVSHARLHLEMAWREESLLDARSKALALSLRSDILRQQNLLEESVRALEQAVGLDPTVASYWNNLGARRLIAVDQQSVEQARRELKKAEADCRKASTVDDYSRPHQNLAFIWMKQYELYHDPGHLAEVRKEALIAFDMATKQLAAGPSGLLVCKGCPTAGKAPPECQGCLKKAQDLLRDLDLVSGDYRVE
ncbi:MAG: CHAT domain-containing protein [Acidobacteria bacterium]|nr:CHAT domain-containing protein [Acidobacteriota bacterium]